MGSEKRTCINCHREMRAHRSKPITQYRCPFCGAFYDADLAEGHRWYVPYLAIGKDSPAEALGACAGYKFPVGEKPWQVADRIREARHQRLIEAASEESVDKTLEMGFPTAPNQPAPQFEEEQAQLRAEREAPPNPFA